jgi:DNA repair ATPase RecN
MNDPIQRIEDQQKQHERRLAELERLERKHSFESRDVAYKTDLAQAMMKALHGDVQEMKSELVIVREDIEYLKLKVEQIGEKLDEKFDLVIKLLSPDK